MTRALPMPRSRTLLAALAALALLMGVAVFNAPSVSAAQVVSPAGQERIVRQAAPDEGGTDSTNAKAAEWWIFAITLGPFTILVTGLLFLTFGWDRATGKDEE